MSQWKGAQILNSKERDDKLCGAGTERTQKWIQIICAIYNRQWTV